MPQFDETKAYAEQEEVFFDDGREIELLHFVYNHADLEEIRGSPKRVLQAIDEYARTKKYLMNVGEDKGKIVTDLIAEVKPQTMVSSTLCSWILVLTGFCRLSWVAMSDIPVSSSATLSAKLEASNTSASSATPSSPPSSAPSSTSPACATPSPSSSAPATHPSSACTRSKPWNTSTSCSWTTTSPRTRPT